MTRIRRCSWDYGLRCTAPATQVVRVTYLDEPIDHDPLFCDAHAEQSPTLLREGWAITATEPLTPDTIVRRKPRRPAKP